MTGTMNHETTEKKKFSTGDPKSSHHLIFLLRFGQTRLVADEGVDGVLALNLMQYALAAGRNATLNAKTKYWKTPVIFVLPLVRSFCLFKANPTCALDIMFSPWMQVADAPLPIEGFENCIFNRLEFLTVLTVLLVAFLLL